MSVSKQLLPPQCRPFEPWALNMLETHSIKHARDTLYHWPHPQPHSSFFYIIFKDLFYYLCVCKWPWRPEEDARALTGSCESPCECRCWEPNSGVLKCVAIAPALHSSTLTQFLLRVQHGSLSVDHTLKVHLILNPILSNFTCAISSASVKLVFIEYFMKASCWSGSCHEMLPTATWLWVLLPSRLYTWRNWVTSCSKTMPRALWPVDLATIYIALALGHSQCDSDSAFSLAGPSSHCPWAQV